MAFLFNRFMKVKNSTLHFYRSFSISFPLKKYADGDPAISKQIEKAKIEIAGEDFREGLTAVKYKNSQN